MKYFNSTDLKQRSINGHDLWHLNISMYPLSLVFIPNHMSQTSIVARKITIIAFFHSKHKETKLALL